MHPMLRDDVVLKIQQEEDGEILYCAQTPDADYIISPQLYQALEKLDGTRPLDWPDQGRRILPKLKEAGLVRTSRLVRSGGLLSRFILFSCGRKNGKTSTIASVLNAALPIAAVLIFVFAVVLFKTSGLITGLHYNIWAYVLVTVISVFLHELGHYISCRAYGYEVSDISILLLSVLPVGVCVTVENLRNEPKGRQVQLYLAGVEMNLLFAGMSLLSALVLRDSSLAGLLVAAANLNVVFAATNLLPISGLDGEAALSAAVGLDSISSSAAKWVLNGRLRKRLLRHGLSGWIFLAGFSLILLLKWGFYAYLLYTLVKLIF